MRGLTHVELAGTLARTAELRYTPTGTAILEATVAGKDHPPGSDQAFAWYHPVKVIGHFAEAIADDLREGVTVYAVGRLDVASWTRPDGTKAERVEIIANTLKTLDVPDDAIDRDQADQPRLLDGVNRVLVMGNLTSDASLHHTTAQRPVTKFRIAVNERRGRDEERTSFLSARCWDGLATAAVHLTKGAPVVASGRLVTESWTTQDGRQRSATKIEAHRIDQVARPRAATPAAAPQRTPAPVGAEAEFPPEEDLPF